MKKFFLFFLTCTLCVTMTVVPTVAVDATDTEHDTHICTEHSHDENSVRDSALSHLLGDTYYLQCIEDAKYDCTPSTHGYANCILPFCDYVYKRGPTFHKRVNHDWSVGWAGQTCKECGRVEVFET